jgi:hypothetical protein
VPGLVGLVQGVFQVLAADAVGSLVEPDFLTCAGACSLTYLATRFKSNSCKTPAKDIYRRNCDDRGRRQLRRLGHQRPLAISTTTAIFEVIVGCFRGLDRFFRNKGAGTTENAMDRSAWIRGPIIPGRRLIDPNKWWHSGYRAKMRVAHKSGKVVGSKKYQAMPF